MAGWRLYPQNVVGAILVPIFLWSIGAAEKSGICSENGKTLPQSHPAVRSERHGETQTKKIKQMPSRKIRLCEWEKNITCQWEKNRQNKSDYGKALSQSHSDIRPARQSESQTKQIKQMRGKCHW